MTDTPRKKYVDPVKAVRRQMRETWGPEVARAITVETQNWRAAHRAAWEQENGPIPGGLLVCHKCDVRSCINPAHLFLGSAADNAQDMARLGRAPEGAQNGELHGRSKLTDEQVRAIRRDSRPLAAIAAEHGVSDSLISRIRNRHLWPHL
jgi:hypothetical protein